MTPNLLKKLTLEEEGRGMEQNSHRAIWIQESDLPVVKTLLAHWDPMLQGSLTCGEPSMQMGSVYRTPLRTGVPQRACEKENRGLGTLSSCHAFSLYCSGTSSELNSDRWRRKMIMRGGEESSSPFPLWPFPHTRTLGSSQQHMSSIFINSESKVHRP